MGLGTGEVVYLTFTYTYAYTYTHTHTHARTHNLVTQAFHSLSSKYILRLMPQLTADKTGGVQETISYDTYRQTHK